MDRWPQTLIVNLRIFVVGIVLGVVCLSNESGYLDGLRVRRTDMLLRPVNTKSVLSNFKFASRISKTQEAEHPYKTPDGIFRHALQGSDIQSLRVIP
jgi:hypothetical protein